MCETNPNFKGVGMWKRGVCILESMKYSNSFCQKVVSQATDSKSPATIICFPRNFMTLKESLTG